MTHQKLTMVASLFALALYLMWSTPALAERPASLENGLSLTLQSEVLKEPRTLWVRLPEGYDDPNSDPARYPVVYLLDAESNFTYFTGLVDRLSRGPYAFMPEVIVVGIVNTDRTRDLTPTVAKSALPPGRSGGRKDQPTGGNALFFKFIQEEVMPAVAARFRTDDYRVLVGHSFGGITALNALLNHNELFNAYLVHDPSLWWDDKAILKQYQQLEAVDFKQRRLYLSQVDESEQAGQRDHYDAIKAFEQLLRQAQFKGLAFEYQQFQNEDHGTIPLVGNNYGLRYVFDGYRINIKAVAKDPGLIERTYAQLSQKLGHTFKPSEAYLNRVGQYLLGTGDLAEAHKYLQQNLLTHPNSPQANQSMADYYTKAKDEAQAQKYQAKAKALGYKGKAK
ncbi:MAG: alpha/beta hydrolase [Neisseriaceae bacterium]|nr:alpha/beta hydrolase [Neisseriaceae bacterium]MBP6863582.1 alpha/beta hydrolase [Neisseriaceae bacterium]